jgi:hypothetical protein
MDKNFELYRSYILSVSGRDLKSNTSCHPLTMCLALLLSQIGHFDGVIGGKGSSFRLTQTMVVNHFGFVIVHEF